MIALLYGDRLRQGLDRAAGTEAQLPDLRKAGCRRIYQETVSSSATDRPELDKCLDRLEKGDTLVVWRLDRLGRSIRDLLQIVDRLEKNGINFISLTGEVRHQQCRRQAGVSLFAALTQCEKELIRERTMAGCAQTTLDLMGQR